MLNSFFFNHLRLNRAKKQMKQGESQKRNQSCGSELYARPPDPVYHDMQRCTYYGVLPKQAINLCSFTPFSRVKGKLIVHNYLLFGTRVSAGNKFTYQSPLLIEDFEISKLFFVETWKECWCLAPYLKHHVYNEKWHFILPSRYFTMLAQLLKLPVNFQATYQENNTILWPMLLTLHASF